MRFHLRPLGFTFANTVLLVFVLFGDSAKAERVQSTTPKVASVTSTRQGAGATQGGISVSLVNLSNLRQTVTVTLLDESVYTFLRVENPQGLSGWDTAYAGNHQTLSVPLASVSKKIVLEPKESKTEVIGGYLCQWRSTGMKCYRENVPPFVCDFALFPAASGPTVNYAYDALASYSYRIQLIVAEDRGAIQASATAAVTFANVVAENGPARGTWTLDFNGGRAF